MKLSIIAIVCFFLFGCKHTETPTTPTVQIVEPESIKNLRARASELNLKWFIRCDEEEPDGSSDAFFGVAYTKGPSLSQQAEGAEWSAINAPPSWTARGKSQEETAEKLLYALRFKGNAYPDSYAPDLRPKQPHKSFCPPELRGE